MITEKKWEERIRDPHAECMSEEERRILQGEKLRKLVKRVYGTVPFYTEKMKELGVEPGDIKSIEDITKLPFTTKDDLRDNYPFGFLAVPNEQVVRVQGTSGTTGKLTVMAYTQKDVDVWGECVARCLTMAGGGHGNSHVSGKYETPVDVYGRFQCEATAFACTPSYAMHLAEAMQEAGVVDKMKIKAAVCGAEPWTVEMRNKIEEILKINCFDIYGLCEISGPGVAMDCIHHEGLHIHSDFFYPEVLDPLTHEPIKDGETGELVFTTLDKEAVPLIRYRTKDLTSMTHETCKCGRTTPRISKFKGRTDDMKVIRGVNVFPTQVETALFGIGEVVPHYLLIIDREDNMDVLTVMVEVDEKFFSDEIRQLDALRHRIGDVLKQALGISVRVKLVEPKTIERSEGKAKRVIDNRNL